MRQVLHLRRSEGDKVLFADDFTQDELGEFPARWKLSIGTFEAAEMKGERWLRCTSADGTIRMKLPTMAALPRVLDARVRLLR